MSLQTMHADTQLDILKKAFIFTSVLMNGGEWKCQASNITQNQHKTSPHDYFFYSKSESGAIRRSDCEEQSQEVAMCDLWTNESFESNLLNLNLLYWSNL